MAVDTRFKRASAMSVLNSSMPTTHTDTTSGVDAEERWAVTWMYSGITITAAVPGGLNYGSLASMGMGI